VAEPVHANIGGASAKTAVPRKDAHEHLIYKQLEVNADPSFLMHGNLMHTSAANKSGKSRVAFNFGNDEGTRKWLVDNYLQPYEGETDFERLRMLDQAWPTFVIYQRLAKSGSA
jgi:hypothetical protein